MSEDKLLDCIKQMEQERREANKTPIHILYRDLCRRCGADVGPTLRSLYEQHRITVGHTINDCYITTT